MKKHKYYPWIVVGLLWIVALLNYMDRQMLSTMKSAMMIDIEELQSAANFGRLMAIFLWIYGFMSSRNDCRPDQSEMAHCGKPLCLVLRNSHDGILFQLPATLYIKSCYGNQ